MEPGAEASTSEREHWRPAQSELYYQLPQLSHHGNSTAVKSRSETAAPIAGSRPLPTPGQLAQWRGIPKAKRQGFSKRAIARWYGISRNTVGKYASAASPQFAAATPMNEDDDV